MNSAKDLWEKILSLLDGDMTPTTIKTWFDETEVIDFQGDTLTLYTPNEFKKQFILDRYVVFVEKALVELFSSPCKVVFLTDHEMDMKKNKKPRTITSLAGLEEYTFDRFVVGNSNKFAHAAAVAVSEQPGHAYNPLLIYGESGLGKTHLLHAIAYEVRKQQPHINIIYIKGDGFTNELIQAIRNGTTEQFQDKYRNADIFLMDDVQFIAGKEATMEEMFNTFNALYDEKKQLIFTSDRPPKEMISLQDRLRTRFESGLMADILPPDLETCSAILKNKALRLGVEIPEVVLDYIANNLVNDRSRTNVRQIEGTVNKIMALRDLGGKDVDTETVLRAVRDILKDTSDIIPTPDVIIEEVANYFGFTVEQIRGIDRSKNISQARNIAIYMIRTITNLSLKDIGKEFDRDHTTIMHSNKRIETLLTKDDGNTSIVIKDIRLNINNRY